MEMKKMKMKKKKMKFDSGQLPKYLIYAFFVWFILLPME